MAEDREDLLKPLLFPLIAKVPSQHAISISSIVRKLKLTYPWLEEKSLRDYDVLYSFLDVLPGTHSIHFHSIGQ